MFLRCAGWWLVALSTSGTLLGAIRESWWIFAASLVCTAIGGLLVLDSLGDELLAALKQNCIFKQNREQEEAEDNAERD